MSVVLFLTVSDNARLLLARVFNANSLDTGFLPA